MELARTSSKNHYIIQHSTGQDEESCSQLSKRKLARIDEFLLNLVRLRLGAPEEDRAYQFDISQSYVSKTRSAWCLFPATQFSCLITWPTHIHILSEHSSCNGLYWAFYGKTVQFEVSKSYVFRIQVSRYSEIPLGVDLSTGAFVYMSPGQSGNASDRYRVENTGILDVIRPGQTVLADRGIMIFMTYSQESEPSFLYLALWKGGHNYISRRRHH